MGKKKAKLPLRQGTQLPPLTEEERLRRRTHGHPLDDFPVSPRMSVWREAGPEDPIHSESIERLAKRITKPLIEPITELTTEPSKTQLNEEIKELNYKTEIKSPTQTERLVKRTTKPITGLLIEPITEPPIEPITKPSESMLPAKEAYVALDATHTASEAKIYSFLYRLSIRRGQPTCRASLAEIHEALGLSKVTIIKALRGLAEKLSIAVLDSRAGSKIGSLYYVYNVKEILARRKEAGIEIDDYKRVVPKGTVERLVERLVNSSETVPLNVQKLNVQLNVQSPTNSLTEDVLVGPRRTTKNLLLRNDDDVSTSSSIGDDDFPHVSSIKQIYCDLTGNEWREQDEQEVAPIAKVPLAHIIIGICYSLDRAAGHRVSSLKYCVPAILDHFDAMKHFPEKALMEIAYAHMLRIKQAMRTNNWTP